MEPFEGYLFSKLFQIGSKSEGPVYFLQQFDYNEIAVTKKAFFWENDPTLHEFLGERVLIEGEMNNDGIVYEKIIKLDSQKRTLPPQKLEIDLEIESDVLLINKTQTKHQLSQGVTLTLLIKWPYRSIWQGCCPTTKLYDFSIEHNGKTIWRWSDGKLFATVVTPVLISGGDFEKFTEVWLINPNQIPSEGEYVAKALFIASGQEISKSFEIKFS